MKYINSQQYDILKEKIMKKYQNSDIYIEKIDFPRNFTWKTCQFKLVLTAKSRNVTLTQN